MALLFITSVMNLWWVAAIPRFVLLEKVAPAGLWIARATGMLLILWGGWMLTTAVRSHALCDNDGTGDRTRPSCFVIISFSSPEDRRSLLKCKYRVG